MNLKNYRYPYVDKMKLNTTSHCEVKEYCRSEYERFENYIGECCLNVVIGKDFIRGIKTIK